MKGEAYEQFIEKFDRRRAKTTDDCYTPVKYYNAIRDYACEKFNIDPRSIIRPFYPGGDYQKEDYAGAVVLDNPPFSMLSEICNWYQERGIKFFLFCNAKTSQGIRNAEQFGFVIPGHGHVIYENGADVATAFVHNFTNEIVLDGELANTLEKLAGKRQFKKTPRPANVYTSADLCTLTPKDGSKIVIKDRQKYKGPVKLYGEAIYIEGGLKQ